jgi:O-Antigen ligase
MAALRGYYRDSYQSSYRALNRQYWAAHLILLSVFAYILFEERFTIGVNTGGRGALQPMDPLIPLVGALVFFGVGRIPGAQLLRLEPRLLIWAPYVALTTALPILAVMVNAEPVRTMYTAIHGFIYLSFLIFGAWAAFAEPSILRLARYYAWFAVIFECFIALVDYLNKTGLYHTALGEFLLQWNVQSEGIMGEFTFITWRCVGTFTNPNELGYWGVTAFWMSALLLRGGLRFTAVVAALLTMLLSESRGSLFALMACSLVWLVYMALSRDRRLSQARDATYVSAIGVLLIGCWLAASLGQSNGVTVDDKFSVITRFERGLDVFTQGAGADENADARVVAWQQALNFYYEHPLGTWSSPRMSFHLYIDNDYVKALLQGSILYLFALLGLYLHAFRRLTAPGLAPRALAMLAIASAVNGMSAYPLTYSTLGVFWIILGYDLTQDWIRSQSLARQRADFRVPREMIAETY